ncbi:MAG: iron ABC transporter permease [Thermodesulfobacteriota bacterium]|jgi:iron complex transport system permease protein
MTRKKSIIVFSLIAALAVLTVSSLTMGRYSAPITEQLRVLFGLPSISIDAEHRQILEQLLFMMRLPRIGAALLIGVALAMAGTTFQAMFRNPLVSPDLLGVMAGSAFGVIIGVILGVNSFFIQLLSFSFGIIAVGLTLLISRIYHRGDRLLILVLAGIICAALFGSLSFLIIYGVEPEQMFASLGYWLDGGLGMATGPKVLLTLPMFAIGFSGILVCSKALNVLSLGEEAATLGINPIFWRVIAIGSATLVSSLTVTLAGMIAWIGLITPHFGRLLIGSDNRLLLPVSGIIGALVLLMADDCTRSLYSSTIPTSLTISIIGIPVFMILLYQSKEGGFHV